eukprot:8577327-Pyramimonas_sp.AAC.1
MASNGRSTKSVLGEIQDYEGKPATLVRGFELPRIAFWHDSESSGRNSQVDPWRWTPEINGLACFRVFKRLSSNEAVPSVEMNPCRGLG